MAQSRRTSISGFRSSAGSKTPWRAALALVQNDKADLMKEVLQGIPFLGSEYPGSHAEPVGRVEKKYGTAIQYACAGLLHSLRQFLACCPNSMLSFVMPVESGGDRLRPIKQLRTNRVGQN
jgi:hypothetical protein